MADLLADLPTEMVRIAGEGIEPPKLVWRRYKRPTIGTADEPGIYEKMLAMNPEMAAGLQDSPFLPVGMTVLIPIDARVLSGAPRQIDQIKLI
jgi:hypothetical protein